MRKFLVLLVAAAASLWSQTAAPIRPPATPLIAHDPYFSVWSMSDAVNAEPTKHWTGKDQPLTGLIRIDGQVHRFLGGRPRWAEGIPSLKQVSSAITPTRTMFGFEGSGVHIDLTFLTPALPDDLDLLSRPATYIVWDVRSTDGKAHDVKVYIDATSHIAVDRPEQRAAWSRHELDGMQIARIGSVGQEMLTRSGDDLRIEWGHFYLAVPQQQGKSAVSGSHISHRGSYARTLDLPPSADLEPPSNYSRLIPLIAATMEFRVEPARPESRYLIAAYDDIYSIEYFQRKLRPYWRRNKMTVDGMLRAAATEYEQLRKRSIAFDEELTRDLIAAGGPKYAALSILAYRQTLAAHKLAADWDGTPLYFSKENFSNGCIATVDVTYPSSPFFLLLNPELLKAQLRPVLDYGRSNRWRFPFAPHDLGQYPLANGQVYGGGEETEVNQMPVEESGNMLIMLAALSRAEGNADFAAPYWPLLFRWAEFLREKGMDPDNQLSTDDFAGHLAHNTNLSVKAIVALASFGQLADAMGKTAEAGRYKDLARTMASRWIEMARDGDHYKLAFDKAGTWSQKYNLVWDKLLGLKLFPDHVAKTELAFYKKNQKPYGLPLDNRSDYTKLDWIVWTATLADNAADFTALTDPVYRFANETPTRVPLSDWYWTTDAKQRGFQARSVVGGVYIKMLEDSAVWKRWAARAGK